MARRLLEGLVQVATLVRVLGRLARALHRRCRIVARQGEPSTLDRLRALDPTCEQGLAAAGNDGRYAA